jgi:hypothetical protein
MKTIRFCVVALGTERAGQWKLIGLPGTSELTHPGLKTKIHGHRPQTGEDYKFVRKSMDFHGCL